jgi:hypothetical protein
LKNAYQVRFVLETDQVQEIRSRVVVATNLSSAIATAETAQPGNPIVLDVQLIGFDVLLQP